MKNILLLEDIPAARKWLSDALREAYGAITIDEAPNVAIAMSLVADQQYDMALIDLHLPDGTGVQVISELNQKQPEAHCIVVSIYDDDAHVFPALQAGAMGYLLKDDSQQQIIASLLGISSGKPPLSPAIARRMLNFFHSDKPEPDAGLTPRERDVLTLIGKGLTLQEVADGLNITHNTSAGYVKVIYRKLNISSRAEAAIEATRMGLISRSPN